jgi:NTE family protein
VDDGRSRDRTPQWPAAELRVTAVDVTNGTFRVLDASSGVPLAVALSASCAVPGVSPTITVDGRPHMDGGMRSGTNADLAQDCDRLLAVACLPEAPENPLGPTLQQMVAGLRHASAAVLVVESDAGSRTAFGANPLLMSTRGASAEACFRQSADVVEEVRAFWG